MIELVPMPAARYRSECGRVIDMRHYHDDPPTWVGYRDGVEYRRTAVTVGLYRDHNTVEAQAELDGIEEARQ